MNKYLEKIAAFNLNSVKKIISTLKGENIVKAKISQNASSKKAEHFFNKKLNRGADEHKFRTENPEDVIGIGKRERSYKSANKASVKADHITKNRSLETDHQFFKSLNHARTLGGVTGTISGGIAGASSSSKDHKLSETVGGALLGGASGFALANHIGSNKYLRLHRGK